MTEQRRGPGKPMLVPYNARALRQLAELVVEHAKKINGVADQLDDVGPNTMVALNFVKAVHDGMQAIRSFVRDAEEKIDRQKFVAIDDSPSPANFTELDELTERLGAESQPAKGARTPEQQKTPRKSKKK